MAATPPATTKIFSLGLLIFSNSLNAILVFLNKISSGKVVLASLSGSTIFYLISNFGVWAFSPMYAKTFTGLVQCYSLALPFYGTSLMGDLVYSAILFGAYQLVFSKNPNFLTSHSKT